MTIHVKLITPITASGMRRSEHLDILSNSELKVTAEQIDIGPNSIECEYEEAMSQPGAILKIIDAEKEGCDAVVIDCRDIRILQFNIEGGAGSSTRVDDNTYSSM